MRWSSLWPLFLVVGTFFFNECLIHYLKIGATCTWPENKGERSLRVFMIADTHLLGQYRGHWLDKLKREWQMGQSFKAAVSLLSPEAVFFLGDLMDEGKWAHEEVFNDYADQFKRLFPVPSDVKLHVLAGNHDLGFHYELYPIRLQWFNSNFNKSLVDLVSIAGADFVLLNSMAFEGDGCQLCREAERQVTEVGLILENKTTRPVLLQHFPLFRKDESECLRNDEFDFSAPKRDEAYRPKWEALSEEATKTLLRELKPSAVFNGHAHRGCKKRWTHPVDLWEYTVNSFSWRNGDRPSLLLASISAAEVIVATCFLPQESTTIVIYFISGVILLCWFIRRVYLLCCRSLSPRRRNHLPLLSETKELNVKCD